MPEPIVGGENYKVTQFFGAGKWGWSESYYLNMNPADGSSAAVSGVVSGLNLARRKGLAQSYTLEAVRIESVTNPARDAALWFAPDLSLGAGQIPGELYAPVWMGWLCDLGTADSVIRDKRIYRGWSTAEINGWSPFSLPTSRPAKVTAFTNAMREVLTVPTAVENGFVGRWAMKSFIRTAPEAPTLPIATVTIDVNGFMQVKVVSTTFPIARGDTLIVRLKRNRCVRGASGRWAVIDVLRDGTSTTMTLNHKICCPPASLFVLTGTAQPLVIGYYGYGYMTSERVVKRDTGRAFFVTRGLQRGKCC